MTDADWQMKIRCIYVEWVDSNSTRGWYQKDTDGPSLIKSIGFEIHRDKDFIVLSTSYSNGGRYLDQVSIPMCAIRTCRVLKSPKGCK